MTKGAATLNYIMVMGRLTADPELKHTEDGTAYCRFCIAVERPKKKDTETETDFFNCVAWRNTAEIIADWFYKGRMIMIVGTLRNNTYEKDGEKRIATQIIVKELHFAWGNKRDNEPESSESIDALGDFSLDDFEEIFSNEDLPF